MAEIRTGLPDESKPMSQITSGIRTILSDSSIYDLFQSIMVKKNARALFSSTYIKARSNDRILDIGCGTGNWRDHLPDVEYYGFDPNPRYIDAAKNKFRNVPGCTFQCASIEDATVNTSPAFDIVLALGVIHHLDDDAAARLVKMAKAVLRTKGRLIMIDPCFVEGQSFVARSIIKLDRGQHVRDVSGYRRLVDAIFDAVKAEVRHDRLRFPYTHLIMECTAE